MTVTRRQVLTGMAGLGALAALPAYGVEAMRLSGRAFGTNWSVLLPQGGEPGLAGKIQDRLERIDRAMSPFRTDSALSAFNRAPAGVFEVDADLAHVTAEALRIATISGGAFDPSVGPLVGRYGFGPIHGERRGDFTGLSVGATTIGKTSAELSLDLCGIAKGYALDALAVDLGALGHADFLIDIGGELLAAGFGPQGAPWRLGISDPLHGGIHTRIAATNLAIATSGDAINAYEVAGRRYSHIIDPKTAEPVRNSLASVSVLHGSAMSADGLATALLVLGPEAGPAWADAQGLPALFLLRSGNGGVDAIASRAFQDLA